jgi:hypothetical protein
MSEQKKLSWSTGPDEVNIQLDGEGIEVDFRISHGVAKNRYPVVFKKAGLEKPEPETGEVVKTHKIGETEIFVTYVKE